MPRKFLGVGLAKLWADFESDADVETYRSPLHRMFFVMTSDMGSDEAYCAKIIQQQVQDFDSIIFYHTACLQHQLHLIVKYCLGLEPGQFNVYAKISNTWRSWSNAAKIKSMWAALYGPERAKVAARSLPPRPLRGRWGSVEDLECFLLRCTRGELLEVFMTALVKKIPASLVEAIQQAHDGQFVFQDDDDDRERYRMQVGKWTLDAVEALQKPEFWAVLLVSHTSRGPITHAMAWIMKSNKTSSQNIDSVVGFVTEAVPKIEKEFATLLNSGDQWSDLLSFISEFGLCESYWLNKAVFHVCSTAANFAKRISFRCAAYPMKLAWMVCSQPTQNCRHRQQIAKEILDMLGLSNGTVQASKASKSSVPDEAWARETLKVCKWLEQDFVQAATNGSWSDQAHYAITCLVGSLHLDTQKIEGLNSTIKMVCKVAPNIHLPLLSARMNIKHSLSQIQSTRDQRQQIIDYAIDTHTATRHWIKAIEDDGAMSKQQRWVPIGLSSSCDAFAPPQPQVLQPAGSDAVTREAGAAEGVNSGDKGQSASSQAPKPRKRTGVKNNNSRNSPNSPNSHLCIHPVLSSYKYDIV